MPRPTVPQTADRETGRRKETLRTADVHRRDSVPIPIVRAGQAQAKVAVPRMQTGRRGRDLEIAGLLRTEIHDQTRPLTTTIGHPLRRQTGAVATRMAAATRMGIAHISHPRARVDRREV